MLLDERERELVFWLVSHPRLVGITRLTAADFKSDAASRAFTHIVTEAASGRQVASPLEIADLFALDDDATEWWAGLDVATTPMFTDATFAYYERKILDARRSRLARALFKLEAQGLTAADKEYAVQHALLEDARARIDEARSGPIATWVDAIAMAKEAVEAPVGLISIGYAETDEVECCLEPSHVMTVLAASSVGKTSFALNVVNAVIRDTTERVLISTLEMPPRRIFARMARIRLGETSNANAMDAILNPYDPAVHGAVAAFQEDMKRVSIVREPSVDGMRRVLYRLDPRPSIVVIDYLGLMELKGKSMYERSSLGIKDIKAFAREEEISVLLLSQVHRPELPVPQASPPTLSSARDSGQIEEMSDQMIGMSRPNFTEERDSRSRFVRINFEVLKNKNGDVILWRAGMDLWTQRINPTLDTASGARATASDVVAVPDGMLWGSGE